MIVRGGHLADCVLGHSRDLGSGVNDCVDHALLADNLAHTILSLADAVLADWVRSLDNGFALVGDTRCASGGAGVGAGSGSVNESMQRSVTGPSSEL